MQVYAHFGFSQSVPDGTVNLPFLVNFATDDLISAMISSDQALTLKVNSTSAPTPTIAVAAGAPIEWSNVDIAANPFTTSPVTVIYINNASGFAAALEMAFAVDSD